MAAIAAQEPAEVEMLFPHLSEDAGPPPAEAAASHSAQPQYLPPAPSIQTGSFFFTWFIR